MRWLLVALVGVLAGLGIIGAGLVLMTRPPDLWFYWEAGRRWPDIYAFRGLAEFEFFRYPPASALVFASLSNIPLPVLQVAWFVMDLALLRWALGSWRLTAVMALMPPIAVDLVSGNVNILAGALLLRLPWANGLLFGFAPKPYIALLALRGGWRGVGALTIAGAFLLLTTALDGWRYLDVLRLTAATEHGTFDPIRLGMPLYLVWVAGWMGLALVARRTWVTAACAAMASPIVHLVYFCAAFMAFAAAVRSGSPEVPAGIRKWLA